MNQNSYQEKLAGLVEIFQGDEEYAKAVLEKWLQKHRQTFEAQIIAEVSRRLEGLNSIVPVTFKVVIDSQGVQLPGFTPPPTARIQPVREKPPAGKKSLALEA